MRNLNTFKIGPLGLGTPFLFPQNPLKYMRQGFDKYGDTYQMTLFRKFVLTRDPAFFNHILVQNHRNYIKGDLNKVLGLVLGNGLLTSDGDFWLRQRRLAQPAFHREKLVKLFDTMGEITRKFILELENSRNTRIKVDEKMMAITADIALMTLFSTISQQDKASMYQQINLTQNYLIKRLRRPYLKPLMEINGEKKHFEENKAIFDGYIYELIENRRKETENYHDLLQLFMDSIDEDTGAKMNDVQVRDEVMTMFAAGHETSANALNWLLYELANQPEITEKIRKETEIFEEVPTFEQLMKMPFSRQVVSEGLRLFPPAWSTVRDALEDDEVDGVKIKKGTTVFLSIFELHRNPNYWDSALKFDPENFSEKAVKNFQKHQYLPFGTGPRVCIGQQFALMEMQLILTSILKKFSFERIPNESPQMFPLITLKSTNGVTLLLK